MQILFYTKFKNSVPQEGYKTFQAFRAHRARYEKNSMRYDKLPETVNRGEVRKCKYARFLSRDEKVQSDILAL